MSTGSSTLLIDQKERRNYLAEISNVERQLWACMRTRGPLHVDVLDLYPKVCHMYEKSFLSDSEIVELQEIEYSLWKFHYKHIDEFRKRIGSEENDSSTSADKHIEGFKLFLSRASDFYQDLIKKIRRYYGLSEEPLLKKLGESHALEKTRLHKCQFVCHRLSVCLGDLARYSELYGKPSTQVRNWSVAAKYYCEAAKIYPDSGNPHNQLAVLATYVGDEFLALYHCVRSLAVKEPFPDALDNLLLLFERNRSNQIQSLSSDAQFNFLIPSQTNSSSSETHRSNGSSNDSLTEGTNLWALIIRTTSFFFLKSGLDDFSCTLAFTVKELESLLAFDVVKLGAMLESYNNFNLQKAGPYQALHIVTVLIFIIHNLMGASQVKGSKQTHDSQWLQLVQLAWTVVFICMGRLVDRCLKDGPDYFPLLPSILVFMEWLAGDTDQVVIGGDDEKCKRAKSYFFAKFGELLNWLHEMKCEVSSPDCIALWEDYEMRGFTPLSHAHLSLCFSTHWENESDFTLKNDYRVHRIIKAGRNIVDRRGDEVGRKAGAIEAEENARNKSSEEQKLQNHSYKLEGRELNQHISGKLDGGKALTVEEEEDIVFKPITRDNSVPLYASSTTTGMLSKEGMKNQQSSSDESLRRASSLLIAQNRALIDSLTTCSATANTSCCGPLRRPDPFSEAPVSSTFSEAPIAAGPPSLSAWVLDGESLTLGRQTIGGISKTVLEPIEEMAVNHLSGLSLGENEDPAVKNRDALASHYYRPPYCAPVPSAPLLPEDASWYSNWTTNHEPLQTGCLSLVDHSFPLIRPMESSPWSFPLKKADSYSSHESARFGVFDGWGYQLASTPTVYLETEPLHPSSPFGHAMYDQKKEMVFQDYTRANYAYGAPRDIRAEQQPLLQYLKEKEWQLQQQSQVSGSTYMRN